MRSVAVTPLSSEAFAPYGAVVERPRRGMDASGPGWSWWAETAELRSDGRAFGIGYLALEPGEPRFDWAEHHLRSQELVVPLDGDCLVYVAPHEDPDAFAVFRLGSGRAVLLEPGIWHGAPLALAAPLHAAVVLAAGTGRDDTTVRRFDDNPVNIRIDHEE